VVCDFLQHGAFGCFAKAHETICVLVDGIVVRDTNHLTANNPAKPTKRTAAGANCFKKRRCGDSEHLSLCLEATEHLHHEHLVGLVQGTIKLIL